MRPGAGTVPHVLIVGGGPAGLETLIALRALAEERVRLTLLSLTSEFSYKPLAVAEPFSPGTSRRYDLQKIAAEHGAELVTGELVSVDSQGHRAVLADGSEISWDILMVAVGCRPESPFPDAVTVLGPGYTSRFRTMLRDLAERRIRRVAFAVPPGVTWALPLYELALMTAARVAEQGLRKVELTVVTPEAAPLEIFGMSASAEVGRMLAEREVNLITGRYPAAVTDGELRLTPSPTEPVPAERVVTMPVLSGPKVDGLPQDQQGFIPVDLHGLVHGEADVYAAGDATTFPVKQGGIATQEADAAAEAIAARVGADVDPQPFRPVLRGMLLTGGVPRYMRAEIGGGRGEDWDVADQALWWPPSKIAGRYIAPFLGLHRAEVEQGAGVEVEMDLARLGPNFRRRAIIAPGKKGGVAAIEVPPEGGGQAG